MADRKRARPTPRRIRTRRIRAAGLVLVTAAVAAALGQQLLASSPSTASSSKPTSRIAVARKEPRDRRLAPPGLLREDESVIPDGTTVFDDGVAGVAKLDPALLAALRQAARQAAFDGVELFVESGWRSADYQKRLLRQAISKYGSKEEAARWVATPRTSAHVSGEAVDIGRSDAVAWLSEHGARYGLCQIYGNESWHYELRPEAVEHGCPPTYADPTHDPRSLSSSS